jgi:hypothetical protein
VNPLQTRIIELWFLRRALGGVSAALLLAATFVGCGSPALGKVSGTVTRKDGTPLAKADLLARSNETGKSASGQTDEQGRYTLTSRDGAKGLPPGDYYVIVAEDLGSISNPRKPTIDGKYANGQSSGLTFSVKAGEQLEFNIALDPSGSGPSK